MLFINKKKLIKNTILCGIALIIIIGYLYYTYPRVFQREYTGIQYRLGDNNFTEEITVMFDGYLIKSFIKGDTFQGKIKVGDQELGKNNFTLDEFGRGIISKADHSFGDVYFDNREEKLSICILEEDDKEKGLHWRQSDGLIIAAPASNRTEALEVSNELMKDVLLHELN